MPSSSPAGEVWRGITPAVLFSSSGMFFAFPAFWPLPHLWRLSAGSLGPCLLPARLLLAPGGVGMQGPRWPEAPGSQMPGRWSWPRPILPGLSSPWLENNPLGCTFLEPQGGKHRASGPALFKFRGIWDISQPVGLVTFKSLLPRKGQQSPKREEIS